MLLTTLKKTVKDSMSLLKMPSQSDPQNAAAQTAQAEREAFHDKPVTRSLVTVDLGDVRNKTRRSRRIHLLVEVLVVDAVGRGVVRQSRKDQARASG